MKYASFQRIALTGALIILLSMGAASGNANLQVCDPCPDCIPPCDFPVSEFCSPIIIDISGGGFHLTSARNGVLFDMTGNGKRLQVGWTASGSLDAFLVLDRNGNGVIDSGKELFGNFTAQPASPNPNGFLALAEYDKVENGGNGDGIIDEKDAIFSSLRLWVDTNHDGVSQATELFQLPTLGVYSISLNYKESRRKDRYGNVFRYRARINVTAAEEDVSKAGPVAYDVFLTALNTVGVAGQ